MIPKGVKDVTALWLTTGEKVDARRGYLLGEKGVLVRISDIKFLTIPFSFVVAVEACNSDKKDLDEMFNGQGEGGKSNV